MPDSQPREVALMPHRYAVISIVAGIMLLAAPSLLVAAIHVPDDQPTIQEAFLVAGDGDTILVAPGAYHGPNNRDIDFAGKAVVLRSLSGQAVTIIDCEGVGRGFYFHTGEDSTSIVEGFTIQYAGADTGAGALCTNGASPEFVQCTFRSNIAAVSGGGVCARASSPIFRFCQFEENDARGNLGGGAIACLAGAGPAVRGCTFTGNTATNSGGAVCCAGSDPVLSNCSFTGNIAGTTGGGAVFCGVSSAPTLTSCMFEGNFATYLGGAIQTQNSSITVTDCGFFDNTAGVGASGIGGALTLHYTSSGHFSGCSFVGNFANVGGAAECFDHADATFTNCTFVANTAAYGVAVSANDASPVFENSIMAFSEGSGAVARCLGTAAPSFSKCVLFANAGGNDLCGSVSDTLHRDPRFCDMAEGEFGLCQNSVCAPDNNAWTELIGALDVECGNCESPVEPASWGAIKALYR
jgi:predicted outer membrane repeat protein